MKIADYARNQEGGWLDMDVTDKELDILVAFVYDSSEEITEKSEPYDKFLHALADNVEIVNAGKILECDFSGFFKPFNEELRKLNKEKGWLTIEFSGDETYYDYVLWLESLIPGYERDSTYEALTNLLSKKGAE